MKILFIHRTFPAQFEHLIKFLLENPENEITYITNNKKSKDIQDVKKIIYEINDAKKPACDEHLEALNDAVFHGLSVMKILKTLKNKGYVPDLIYGFSGWGSSMFVKEVYPDVPYLCYFEWFGRSKNSIYDFDGTKVSDETKALIKCNNANILMDLDSCDGGITPTKWQKNLFPKSFQNKIKVLHEGIDTDICKPDSATKIWLEDKKIFLTSEDEVITYGTRGMEPYRGFPQFMKAAEILLKKRPNLHILIAGADKVFYGSENKSYKDEMLSNLDIDMERVHFLGVLPFESFIGILQISSAHIYLTYPFMLSWSVLNALSTGCCVIASDTEPVKEVITDGYNGFLTDFFDTKTLADKIEFALTHKDFTKTIRKNARQTVLDKYSLKKLLPKHISYVKSFYSNSKNAYGE